MNTEDRPYFDEESEDYMPRYIVNYSITDPSNPSEKISRSIAVFKPSSLFSERDIEKSIDMATTVINLIMRKKILNDTSRFDEALKKSRDVLQ